MNFLFLFLIIPNFYYSLPITEDIFSAHSSGFTSVYKNVIFNTFQIYINSDEPFERITFQTSRDGYYPDKEIFVVCEKTTESLFYSFHEFFKYTCYTPTIYLKFGEYFNIFSDDKEILFNNIDIPEFQGPAGLIFKLNFLNFNFLSDLGKKIFLSITPILIFSIGLILGLKLSLYFLNLIFKKL